MNTKKRLVIAASFAQYRAWCHKNGISTTDQTAIYCDFCEKMRGHDADSAELILVEWPRNIATYNEVYDEFQKLIQRGVKLRLDPM